MAPLRRFYVEMPLAAGQTVTLPAHLQHRLHKVLRWGEGVQCHLFNGRHGLFAVTITHPQCRAARIETQLQPQTTPAERVLVLALPKREAWETALRQATEMGVTAIQPLKTEYAQVAKLNLERAHAYLVEAAEQSERLSLPTLHAVQTLPQFLKVLSQPCAWAYERAAFAPAQTPQANFLLVGPEGGFSPAEVFQLQAHPHIQPFSLGATILRVDTAVVAGLALIRPN